MKQNMSNPDHGIRALIVNTLFVIFFSAAATCAWAIIDLGAAFILFGTITVGVCPIYKALGINTKPKQERFAANRRAGLLPQNLI